MTTDGQMDVDVRELATSVAEIVMPPAVVAWTPTSVVLLVTPSASLM